MESKKFDTYSNPYTFYTPITAQIDHWLDKNPNIKIKDLQVNKDDAIIFYENPDTTL